MMMMMMMMEWLSAWPINPRPQTIGIELVTSEYYLLRRYVGLFGRNLDSTGRYSNTEYYLQIVSGPFSQNPHPWADQFTPVVSLGRSLPIS